MLPVLRRRCETEKDECVQSWIVGNADSENKQIVNLKMCFYISIKHQAVFAGNSFTPAYF